MNMSSVADHGESLEIDIKLLLGLIIFTIKKHFSFSS